MQLAGVGNCSQKETEAQPWWIPLSFASSAQPQPQWAVLDTCASGA